MRRGISVLMIVLFAAAPLRAEEPIEAVLHVSFDESIDASDGQAIAAGDVTFVEGIAGRALDARRDICVEYRDAPMPAAEAGAIELWFNSRHDSQELADHPLVVFVRDDGSPAIEIKFYHVEMSVQVTMWGPDGGSRRYAWGWAQDQWQHVVVSWQPGEDLMVYRDGVESGHAKPYRGFYPPARLRIGGASDAGPFAAASIDQVVVYDRPLTPSQVQWLYQHGDEPFARKLPALRQVVAAEQALRQRRRDRLFNDTAVGFIHGRNTSLNNWPATRFDQLELPMPTMIHETALTEVDLSRYDVLIVPGGGGLNLDDANRNALLDYVRQGGGYVGICGGAISAGRYGLIDARQHTLRVRGGIYSILKPHPITDGYNPRRQLLIAHANGPLFVLREDSDEEPVITFAIGGEGLPTFVSAIARRFGDGRVAVFSGHPEGDPRTYLLLRNAVMWAAGITGIESE
jgi:hypothetical protein